MCKVSTSYHRAGEQEHVPSAWLRCAPFTFSFTPPQELNLELNGWASAGPQTDGPLSDGVLSATAHFDRLPAPEVSVSVRAARERPKSSRGIFLLKLNYAELELFFCARASHV